MDLSDEQMQEVLNQMDAYWQNRDLLSASVLFNDYIDREVSGKRSVHFKSNLCGLMTDVCDLAKNSEISEEFLTSLESSQEKATLFYAENLTKIQKIYNEGLANYNYATSLSTLFALKRLKNNEYLLPKNAELLVKSKRQFWIGIRAAKGKAKLEMMTNLAHVLSDCSRITECLYLYDSVIKIENNFPQANYSKAKSLEYLSQLASGYSINQMYEVYCCYKTAHESPLECHPTLKEQSKVKSKHIYSVLLEHGVDNSQIIEDKVKNDKEFNQHSDERRFYIENGMALSEHSLYCGCNGASRDNLSIIKPESSIAGTFVPRMEYFLNQMKVEYYKARELYYKSCNEEDSFYRQADYEQCLTDLGNFDLSGAREEDMRLSFKSCYGILDKIALCLCELFDLPFGKNEKIYFETFWKKQHGRDSEHKEDRWQGINAIESNPSLFALYFQSTDLDSKKGEWRNFKKWRNSLEHGFLALTSKNCMEAPYGIFDGKIKVVNVDSNIFREKTSELLRFVRSAIFNFTFCVRREAEKEMNVNDQEKSILVKFNKK